MSSADKLKNVVVMIEATQYEQMCLHQKHRKEMHWEEDLQGCWVIVGYISGKPVGVSFSFAKVYGQQICFFEPTSVVVDYDLIHKWVTDHYPNISWCDNVFNFSHIKYNNKIAAAIEKYAVTSATTTTSAATPTPKFKNFYICNGCGNAVKKRKIDF